VWIVLQSTEGSTKQFGQCHALFKAYPSHNIVMWSSSMPPYTSNFLTLHTWRFSYFPNIILWTIAGRVSCNNKYWQRKNLHDLRHTYKMGDKTLWLEVCKINRYMFYYQCNFWHTIVNYSAHVTVMSCVIVILIINTQKIHIIVYLSLLHISIVQLLSENLWWTTLIVILLLLYMIYEIITSTIYLG